MNNENNMNNQNLNNNNIESLNTTPISTPIPNNNVVTPAPNNNQVVNQIPNQNFNSTENMVTNPNVQNPNMANMNTYNPVNNGSINLQPAGIVPPNNNDLNNNIVEPLQATSLNSQTVMNPNNNMNNSMNYGQPNNFNQPINNPNNNIGMMGGVPIPPSIPEEPKSKKNRKPINTPLLIILVVVLIACVGFGIYYFLTTSKSKTPAITITPILTNVELGKEIANDPSLYAKITGVSVSSCTVNTNLNSSKVGTYEYTVTCGNKTSPAQTVVVEDTTPPIVETKEVIVVPNTPVTAEDFILNVEDASYDLKDDTTKPTIEFEDGETVDTSSEGEQNLSIVVSDVYENEIAVKVKLTVSNNAPQEYMYCETTLNTEVNATANATYRFGITSLGELYNSKKVITYEFEDEETYNNAVKEIEETGKYDNYEGSVFMDEQSYTITITIDLTNDDLLKDFDLDSFPTSEGDIEALFTNPCEYSED